jgi:hypothetical protein
MFRFLLFGLLSALLLTAVNADPVKDKLPVAIDDWPWWRGPNRDGVADPKQQPPRAGAIAKTSYGKQLSRTRSWFAYRCRPIRLLATADEKEQVQSVLCYERDTANCPGKLPFTKVILLKEAIQRVLTLRLPSVVTVSGFTSILPTMRLSLRPR